MPSWVHHIQPWSYISSSNFQWHGEEYPSGSFTVATRFIRQWLAPITQQSDASSKYTLIYNKQAFDI